MLPIPVEQAQKNKYTPEIYNYGGIFSAGKGKLADGTDIDYSSSITNGQLSVVVKGRTLKQELEYNRDTWAEWASKTNVVGDSTGLEFTMVDGAYAITYLPTNLKPTTKYGILVNIVKNELTTKTIYIDTTVFPSGAVIAPSGITGNRKIIATTKDTISSNRLYLQSQNAAVDTGKKVKIIDIRCFELPAGSEIEQDFETMTADELAQKYPYIQGGTPKSTLSGCIWYTGKNLCPTDPSDWEQGSVSTIQGINVEHTLRLRTKSRFRIPHNADLVFSKASGYTLTGIYLYDVTGKFLYYTNTPQIRSTDVETYARITIRKVPEATINSEDVTSAKPQLELGTVATDKVAYKEPTIVYANGILRSLPNGTNDEVSVSEGKRTKRVSDEVIVDGDLNWRNFTDRVDYYSAFVDGWARENNALQWTNNSGYGYSDDGYYIISNSFDADKRKIILGSSNLNSRLTLYIEKEKIDTMPSGSTLQGFKEYLNQHPITLIYQLLQEKITPTTPQIITAKAGDTIMWLPHIKEKQLYDSGITITNTDLPIKSLISVTKINTTTGEETDIAISTCTVAEGGGSFTSTALTDNDSVVFVYEYDTSLTTIPTIVTKYVLSRTTQADENTKGIQLNNKAILTLEDRLDLMYADLDFKITLMGGI